MKITFSSESEEIEQIIYPTFVRPHLKFVSSVCNPQLEYDSKTLESVTPPSYEKRLKPYPKIRFDRPENKTKKRRFQLDLQARTRSSEGKLVR